MDWKLCVRFWLNFKNVTMIPKMNLDKLKELEKVQNEGRGVSCVRSIILYLEREDVDSACACCWNENDKLRSYPAIEAELRNLLPAEKLP